MFYVARKAISMLIKLDPNSWDLKTDPFPYAVVHPALPWDVYERLDEEFPDYELIKGDRPEESNVLYQYHAAHALHDEIGDLWREFFLYHTSKEYYRELDKAVGITDYYPVLEGKSIGVRYRDRDAQIKMDCLFGVNSPVKRASTVKGPHLDNPKEIYACMLYFPEKDDDAGGGLTLFRYANIEPVFYGKRFCDDVTAEVYVPYERNTAVFFINTQRSLHGVGLRQPTDKIRRYVNVECEFHEKLY